MKNLFLLFLIVSIFACQNSNNNSTAKSSEDNVNVEKFSDSELNQIKNKISIRGTEENGEVVSSQDISEIKFISPGMFNLKFTPSGKEKIRLITTANLNKNIEVRIGNEIVSKPVVQEIIDSEEMQITGINVN